MSQRSLLSQETDEFNSRSAQLDDLYNNVQNLLRETEEISKMADETTAALDDIINRALGQNTLPSPIDEPWGSSSENKEHYIPMDDKTKLKYDPCIPVIPSGSQYGPSQIASHYWMGENSCCISLSPNYEEAYRSRTKYALKTQYALHAPIRGLYRLGYHLCGATSESSRFGICVDRVASFGLCLLRVPYTILTCSFVCCGGLVGKPVANACSIFGPERQEMDSDIVTAARNAAHNNLSRFFKMFLEHEEVRDKLLSGYNVTVIFDYIFHLYSHVPLARKKQALIYLNRLGHHIGLEPKFGDYIKSLLNFTPEHNELLEFMFSHNMIILSESTAEKIVNIWDDFYFNKKIPVDVARKTSEIFAKRGVLTRYHQDLVKEKERDTRIRSVFCLFPSGDVVNLICAYAREESILPRNRPELKEEREKFYLRMEDVERSQCSGLLMQREH